VLAQNFGRVVGAAIAAAVSRQPATRINAI
jgi:hypothetical protein